MISYRGAGLASQYLFPDPSPGAHSSIASGLSISSASVAQEQRRPTSPTRRATLLRRDQRGDTWFARAKALNPVRGTPEEQRANHWFATFCTALDKDNTQGSESTITMQETIDALKESADA